LRGVLPFGGLGTLGGLLPWTENIIFAFTLDALHLREVLLARSIVGMLGRSWGRRSWRQLGKVTRLPRCRGIRLGLGLSQGEVALVIEHDGCRSTRITLPGRPVFQHWWLEKSILQHKSLRCGVILLHWSCLVQTKGLQEKNIAGAGRGLYRERLRLHRHGLKFLLCSLLNHLLNVLFLLLCKLFQVTFSVDFTANDHQND